MNPTADKAFKIRTANMRDLPIIAEMKDKLDRHHHYSGLWPPEGGRRENLRRYRQMIRGKADRIFVAECSPHEIVGYLTVSIRTRDCADRDFRRIGFIGEAFVEKTKRRQGVGRALVEAAAQFFSKRNIRQVTLRNIILNKPANRFWGRLSFRPILYTRTTSIGELTRTLHVRRPKP